MRLKQDQRQSIRDYIKIVGPNIAQACSYGSSPTNHRCTCNFYPPAYDLDNPCGKADLRDEADGQFKKD